MYFLLDGLSSSLLYYFNCEGIFDGFYPYFFLNPNEEIPSGVGSYSNDAAFIAVFLFVYIMLSFLLIILNRILMSGDNKKDIFDS
ncbi:hypothetical protein [Oceanobacillus sojae]|uniref:Uncharacterized protein n=1 Tax=Oceanobacillus sojae TaxID=582851 RepID=A0A511ZEU3_9BACI|nr:hypothetical protein [Oceanobacillus sojae]GEN85967.1 hypothetical protein OSO01_07060 [Oceanobacillus sojae]